MPLTKIPFILLMTWGVNTSFTPPHPPPPEHERITSRVPMENPIYTKWVPYISTVTQLFTAIAEVAIILASAAPSQPIPKAVLSLLVWSDGNPDNLCMSNTAVLGVFLVVFGTCIRLTTYHHLGRFFRFQPSIQKDHKLIVSGPYSIVRHPGYTGLVLVYIGWFLWQVDKGSWVMESGIWNTTLGRISVVEFWTSFLTSSYLVLGRMSKEDAALRGLFGRKWDDWAKRVPYSVFPGIY